MDGQQCVMSPLAGSRACTVWLCEDCRIVHLSIGPVSLRLKIAHFLKTVETLQEAVQQLRMGGNTTTTGNASAPAKVHH